MKTRFHDLRDPVHGRRPHAVQPAMPGGRFLKNRFIATTNITSVHKRAFKLTGGPHVDFALFC